MRPDPHPVISTRRLLLRRLRDEDFEEFALLNGRPAIMEFFANPWSHAESELGFARYRKHWSQYGFGRWTIAVSGESTFAGVTGLNAPFGTAGTQLDRMGSPSFGCDCLSLDEIIAFSVPANGRSIGMMKPLGMRRTSSDDFDRPAVPEATLSADMCSTEDRPYAQRYLAPGRSSNSPSAEA